MSVRELVEYITKTYHEPLRKDLRAVEAPVYYIINNYSVEFPEFKFLKDLFSQFKNKILKHITREDLVTFPAIINYEQYNNNDLFDLSDNFEIIEKLVNDTKMKNEHGNFNSYLNSILQLINGSEINKKDIKEFNLMSSLFHKIHNDNIQHSKLENHDLYSKGMKLQEKLRMDLKKYD